MSTYAQLVSQLGGFFSSSLPLRLFLYLHIQQCQRLNLSSITSTVAGIGYNRNMPMFQANTVTQASLINYALLQVQHVLAIRHPGF